MANLDRETIKNLTALCRIDCSEDEQISILGDLQKIIDYINQLEEVNTDNVEPCYHVLDNVINVTREDVVSDQMPRETFLALAPSHTGGLVKVPPVIK